MKTRIYIVGHGEIIRVIRAKNRQEALEHAVKGVVNVSPISKKQLEEHMILGTKIEDATGGVQLEIAGNSGESK